MTQQDKYEYKLEIASLSTETDGIRLKKWRIMMVRSKVYKATFRLARTSDAITVDTDDTVTFYRREFGEATWGQAWFRGYVKKVSFRDTLGEPEVSLICWGFLGKLKARTIPTVGWGNTHIVDKEYAVTYTGTKDLVRKYADLDAGNPAQVPLEEVKVLNMREFVNGGNLPTWRASVYYYAAGNSRETAQCFNAWKGPLRKLFLYCYISDQNVDLKVAIQAPNANGYPDGVDITSVMVSSSTFPLGAGNAGWIEVDLLNNVADAWKLSFIPGKFLWVVISQPSADPTQTLYLYTVQTRPTPKSLFSCYDTNGAGWGLVANWECIYFGLDFEENWELCDYSKRDYVVFGDLDPPRIFFEKSDYGAGDLGGEAGQFLGKTFTILYSGQKSVRATYWKGTITYATVVQKWAQSIASDMYDVLDINLTEPSNKQFSISVQHKDGLAAIDLIRQYCPIHIRWFYNSSSQDELEVRDEKEPTTTEWNNYTATQKAKRTFRHGQDTSADSEIRIINSTLSKELVKEVHTQILFDGVGNVIGMDGDGPVIGSGAAMVGGSGGRVSAGLGFIHSAWEKHQTIKKSGTITVTGIDQSVADGPFRHPNELVYIQDSKIGWDDILAVLALTWSGGKGAPTTLKITFSDTVYDVVIPAVNPGGSSAPELTTELGGSSEGFGILKDAISPPDGRSRGLGELPMSEGTDTPMTRAPTPGFTNKADQPIFQKDLTVTYDNTKFYWVRLGTGTPVGNALGNQVAEVLAHVIVSDYGSAPDQQAMIMATIYPEDLGLAQSWPTTITEMGIATSVSETGPKTDVKAWSLGVPSGTYDIFNIQPEMGPGKAVTVFIRIEVT